jgi:hypothetical protein
MRRSKQHLNSKQRRRQTYQRFLPDIWLNSFTEQH